MSYRNDLTNVLQAYINEKQAQEDAKTKKVQKDEIIKSIKFIIETFGQLGIEWKWEDFQLKTIPANGRDAKQMYLQQYYEILNMYKIAPDSNILKGIIEELKKEAIK